MASADPSLPILALPWGAGALGPAGWTLQRAPSKRREESVRAKLLAAIEETTLGDPASELAAWCAPMPGEPVGFTLATWLLMAVTSRCLYLEAAAEGDGYVLEGHAVLALVDELSREDGKPDVEVGLLKDSWDGTAGGQVVFRYVFKNYDPLCFARAARRRTKALPATPAAFPDAWKQLDPALAEIREPDSMEHAVRLMRWAPGRIDDGAVLPPLDPALAAAFGRLGVELTPEQKRAAADAAERDPLQRAARNALGSSDATIARLADEKIVLEDPDRCDVCGDLYDVPHDACARAERERTNAPTVVQEPAPAAQAPANKAATVTAPPATGAVIHGSAPNPGGTSTTVERVQVRCPCGRNVTLDRKDLAKELERCADCSATPDKRTVTDLANESAESPGDLFGHAPEPKKRPSRKRGS